MQTKYGPDPYTVTYQYSPSGNILRADGTNTRNSTYGYGLNGAGPHAVHWAGGWTYHYHAAGNQTKRVTGIGTQDLICDVQNRLVQITGAGPDMAALYDADGVRVKRTLDTDVTYYLTDGFETDGVTDATVHHGLAGMSAGSTVSGTCHVGTTDHLGSGNYTRSGTGVVARNRYQPYGQRRGAAGNTLPTDLTFTGQTDDPGTGLVDYNARHYDPVLGRFIMADTVRDGASRYEYGRSSPLSGTDPSGNCWVRSGDLWCHGTNYGAGGSGISAAGYDLAFEDRIEGEPPIRLSGASYATGATSAGFATVLVEIVPQPHVSGKGHNPIIKVTIRGAKEATDGPINVALTDELAAMFQNVPEGECDVAWVGRRNSTGGRIALGLKTLGETAMVAGVMLDAWGAAELADQRGLEGADAVAFVTGRTASSVGGAVAGAKAGCAFGLWLAGAPGCVGGGAIGGFGGSEAGKWLFDFVVDNWNNRPPSGPLILPR